MPYITASGQPSGYTGRTYFNVNYNHQDGSNWCGLVEQVMPGETEISPETYQSMWQENQTANLAYEAKQGQSTEGWDPTPTVTKLHDEMVTNALDPNHPMTLDLVVRLLGDETVQAVTQGLDASPSTSGT